MEWNDRAVVVHSRVFGERRSLYTILTKNHGLYRGMITKKISQSTHIFPPGSIGLVNWKGRLPDHLGIFSIDIERSLLLHLLPDAARLYGLQFINYILYHVLAVNHPYPKIFDHYLSYIHSLYDANWLIAQVILEMALLKELGFGLSLSQCAVTGARENLTHISPKTGRAVCTQVAEPYKDRLFPIPDFLRHIDESSYLDLATTSLDQIHQALSLTSYFLFLHFPHIRYVAAPLRQLMIEACGGDILQSSQIKQSLSLLN